MNYYIERKMMTKDGSIGDNLSIETVMPRLKLWGEVRIVNEDGNGVVVLTSHMPAVLLFKVIETLQEVAALSQPKPES